MRWDGPIHLAHELGMHLHDLMGWLGPMTHRQFVVWEEWLGEQWDKPNRTDHYIMKAGAMAGRVREIDLNKIKIQFKQSLSKPAKPPREMTLAEADRASKERWAMRRKAVEVANASR